MVFSSIIQATEKLDNHRNSISEVDFLIHSCNDFHTQIISRALKFFQEICEFGIHKDDLRDLVKWALHITRNFNMIIKPTHMNNECGWCKNKRKNYKIFQVWIRKLSICAHPKLSLVKEQNKSKGQTKFNLPFPFFKLARRHLKIWMDYATSELSIKKSTKLQGFVAHYLDFLKKQIHLLTEFSFDENYWEESTSLTAHSDEKVKCSNLEIISSLENIVNFIQKTQDFLFNYEQNKMVPQLSRDQIMTIILDRNIFSQIFMDNKLIGEQENDLLNSNLSNVVKVVNSINLVPNKFTNKNEGIVKIMRVGINQKVKIIFSGNIKAFLIKENQEIEFKQENLPTNLKKISTPEQFNAILKNSFLKLSTYEEGEIRLYINQCLKGGGRDTYDYTEGLASSLLKKQSSQSHFKLGEDLFQQGKYQEAIVYFDKAIAIYEEMIYFLRKSMAQIQLDQYKEAIKSIDKALQKDSNSSIAKSLKVKVLEKIAGDLYNQGNYEEALRQIEIAIKINPEETSLHFQKGLSLIQLKKYEESLPSFEKIISQDSQNTKYFQIFIQALALAVEKQRKKLSIQESNLLKQALLSKDILQQRNGCKALSHAAENQQNLPNDIIFNLLDINNQQELGDICELSSNAVKHNFLNNPRIQIDSSMIDLLEAGLKHSNIKVKENIILSFGYIAKKGVSISNSVIQIIEDNLVDDQSIESSIDALFDILGTNKQIDLNLKTTKQLLKIGINTNLSYKLQQKSLECLVFLLRNGKFLSSEVINDLSLVLENQYPAIRKIGLEIILRNLKNNNLLNFNIIDSLGKILETDPSPILNILKQISQRLQFPNRALTSLSNLLKSAKNDETRSQTLLILEDQNNKFTLNSDLKYLLRIEEEAKILFNEKKPSKKIESLKFLQDQAKSGKFLTQNCLRILEQLLLNAQKEVKLACSVLISNIISNGQEIPKSLSDIIAGEIVQTNKQYQAQSLEEKINVYMLIEPIDTSYLLSLFKVISDTEYVPENAIKAFETSLINNQSEMVYLYSAQGLKILTQRGYNLSQEGIENCLSALRSINFKKDVASDLSIVLKNTSNAQIFSKKAFDNIFELLSLNNHGILINLINTLENNFRQIKTKKSGFEFDSKKLNILEKLINSNQVNCSLLKIIDFIPNQTLFLSNYSSFEKSLQNLIVGKNEEKQYSIVQLQRLIQNDYPITAKLIQILLDNLETKGATNCLEQIIQKDKKFIENLNLELLSKKLNQENYLPCLRIFLKCIEHNQIFSEAVVINLSKLLNYQQKEIKDSTKRILIHLSEKQTLPENVINLIALEENIDNTSIPILKIVCERLGQLEELSENHLQKLNIILSTSDEELFDEGCQVALKIIQNGQSLPEHLIEKVIVRVNNSTFASDWLVAFFKAPQSDNRGQVGLQNVPQSNNLKRNFLNKIIDCLSDDNLQIKLQILSSLKQIVEFFILPDSIETKMQSCILPLTGENNFQQLISKEAIGSLGIYYSNKGVNSSQKIIFQLNLDRIATYLPPNLVKKVFLFPNDKKAYILSSLISSDLSDQIFFEKLPIIEIPREILKLQLLTGYDNNEASFMKFVENFQLFEKNNHKLYESDCDQILRLLILQKERYDFNLEQINDCLIFLSGDHKKVRKQNFLCDNVYNELKSNWLSCLLQKWNNNLPQNKVNQLIQSFELYKFHTPLVLELCSRISIPYGDRNFVIDRILSFLEFIKENKISQSQLLQVILSKISSNNNSLFEWQKNLSKLILKEMFKYNGDNGENGCKLMESGWDMQSTIEFIKEISNMFISRELVNQVFDIISGYKIPKSFQDSNNTTIYSLIKNYNSNEWIKRLYKLALSANFTTSVIEKDIPTLLWEIKESNIELNISELETQLYAINHHFEQIKNWSEKDIEFWVQFEGKVNANKKQYLPKILAVLSKVNIITSGNKPRATQLLSLLMLMDAKQNKGRIAQIATGEGKSTIVAMLAAIKALQGETVDIITSSEVLATRDAEEKKSFFNLLKLTVADNSGDNAPDCYNSNVVYGDISDFEGDLLRNEFNGSNIKGNRGFGTVIVDEVDSMCIDNIGSSTRLGSHFVGFEYLDIILIFIWKQLDMVDNQIQNIQGKLVYLPPELRVENDQIIQVSEDVEIDFEQILEVGDRREFTKETLKSNVEKIINESKNPISENQLRIPKHLIEFALIELDEWIDSAYRAKHCYNKEEDYVISKRNGEDVIAPVDYRNTGVVQVGTTWGNALHQFLQIKHGLKITAESLSTSFISNIGYFYRYINKNYKGDIISNKIFGLTGTLGSNDSQVLLKETYDIDIVFVPTYKKKQFLELPAIIAPGKWRYSIIKSIQEETSKGRAVLVICQTIDETDNIKGLLSSQGYPRNKIRVYGRSDNDDSKVVQNALDVGDVIIATNLAGRGTDIKTTEALEKNGGLHVCVTFLPTNLRVEQQNFGRTSRQGKSGTAQLVLYNKGDIQQIKIERDEKESKRLEEIKSTEIERIKIKDELFKNFCILKNKLKAIEDNSYKLKCLEEQWGVWLRSLNLEDKEKSLDIKAVKNQFKEFEIKLSNDFKVGSIVHNPFSHIENANDLLKNKKYQASIEFYDKAISLDPSFSFAANYNKAFALIQLKDYNFKERAISELKEASKFIEQSILPQMQTVQITFADVYKANAKKDPNDTELYKKIMERSNIINQFNSYINHALTILLESQKEENKKNEIKVSNIRDLNYYSEQNIASKGIIQSLKEAGIYQFYELNSKPPTPWLKICGVALLGLAQATVGVFITAYSPQLGAAFISEGISDLIYATQSAISGSFDWNKYKAQKAISMTISISCMGWSAIKTAAKNFKDGLKHCAKSLKNAVVNGFKNASNKILGTTFQKTVTKGLFQEGLSIAAKTVTKTFVEKGVEKLVTYGVDKVIESIFESIRDNTQKYFREHFSEKMNSNKTVLYIDSLIAIDSYLGNNNWQSQIKNSAIQIIHPEKNKWVSFFEPVLKQVIPHIGGQYNSSLGNTLGTIVKLIDLVQFSKNIYALVQSFYDKFHQSLQNMNTPMEYDSQKNSLNSLENLIRNINHKEITVDGATEIVNLLYEQGVIQENGEFDAQILSSHLQVGSTRVINRKILITTLKSNSVKRKICSINHISLGKYMKYKQEIIKLCQNLHNQLTSDHSFSRKNLYHDISEEILGTILNTFNDFCIKPTTDKFIQQHVGKIYELASKSLNIKSTNVYRSQIQLSLNSNKIGNQESEDLVSHLSESERKEVFELVKNKKGEYSDLPAISSRYKIRIEIYKDGELFDIVGDRNSGEPLRIDYDSQDEGHWSPHGHKAFENKEFNNCLFEAIKKEGEKQNLQMNADDLKIQATLDKVQNKEKYKELNVFRDHLASCNNRQELLMQGGGILNEFHKIQKVKGINQKKKIVESILDSIKRKNYLSKEKFDYLSINIKESNNENELNNTAALLHLLIICGNINPKYPEEIICGGYVRIDDNGELYEKLKKLACLERNIGKQSLLVNGLQKVKYSFEKILEIKNFEILNKKLNKIDDFLNKNGKSFSIQTGEILRELKVELIDGKTCIQLEFGGYPHDPVEVSLPSFDIGLKLLQVEGDLYGASFTIGNEKNSANLKIKTGGKELIFSGTIKYNYISMTADFDVQKRKIKLHYPQVDYSGQSSNGKHKYNVLVNEDGIQTIYTFLGPKGITIGAERRGGVTYFNVGAGIKLGKINLQLISIKTSSRNVHNCFLRFVSKGVTTVLDQAISQYGSSSFTESNPINISKTQLKKEGKMSDDEEDKPK